MNNSLPDNEESKNLPSDESQKDSEDVFAGIKGDGIFTFKISEDMEIRNILRAGLVDAQGKDTDKIPLYISWPNWLDDGIICMFAKDFHNVLCKAIKDTVVSLNETFGVEGLHIESGDLVEEQGYDVETVSEVEDETATEIESVTAQEETTDVDSVEAEQEAGKDEAETAPEHETAPEVEQESATPEEEEEKPEKHRRIARGQDLADHLFKELKKEEDE